MSGVVLAGGASRRMGVDKATLRRGDERYLDLAVRHLRGAGADPVVVAVGAAGRLPDLPRGTSEVADPEEHRGAGPLAGLLAGLRGATGIAEVVAVLAVDLPDASPGLLRWLRSEWRAGDDRALVPVDAAGRPQPLHALYAVGVAADVEDHLRQGRRRVLELLDRIGARRLAPPPDLAAGDWSRNHNRPE